MGGGQLSFDGPANVFLGILDHRAQDTFFRADGMRRGSQLIALILFPVLKSGAVLLFKRWFIVRDRHAGTLPQKVATWQSRQPVNNPKRPCLLRCLPEFFFRKERLGLSQKEEGAGQKSGPASGGLQRGSEIWMDD